MKLHWTNVLEMSAIGFGYTTHQLRLREALVRQGVEFTDDADIEVSIVPAGDFIPVRKKFNVLYTMYESTTIPDGWIKRIQGADLIVVPCKQNKDLFSRYTKRPVEVCWEGVEVDKFVYKERFFPTSRPFIYLWFGATNERKGYKHTIVAWHIFREKYPELIDKTQLIMKTTQMSEGERIIGYKKGKSIKKKMPVERVFKADNAIVDTRKLPVLRDDKLPGLVDLYHDVHAFVLPSMGEGFGLTLAEAMATGLPCIYTPWSGPRDFIDSNRGYPVKWKFAEIKAMTPMPDGSMQIKHHSTAASADPNSIVQRMIQIYSDYDTALKKGKRASKFINKYITWDISAMSFIKLIEKYTGERLAA